MFPNAWPIVWDITLGDQVMPSERLLCFAQVRPKPICTSPSRVFSIKFQTHPKIAHRYYPSSFYQLFTSWAVVPLCVCALVQKWTLSHRLTSIGGTAVFYLFGTPLQYFQRGRRRNPLKQNSSLPFVSHTGIPDMLLQKGQAAVAAVLPLASTVWMKSCLMVEAVWSGSAYVAYGLGKKHQKH